MDLVLDKNGKQTENAHDAKNTTKIVKIVWLRANCELILFFFHRFLLLL